MTKLIIDSSAWIEYFSGTAKGETVKELIENNEAYAVSITLAEVISKLKREKMDFEKGRSLMLSNAKIVDCNANISFHTGSLHAEIKQKNKKFSLSDAFVLQTARSLNAKIVTGDYDFKGFKETILI